MDDKKSEFIWNVHSYINEYIRFADTKAELVIVWDTAVIGGLLASDFHLRFDRNTGIGIACMVAFGAIVLSFTVACWAVVPRLPTSQKTGFVFWKGILAHKSKDAFVSKLKAEPSGDLADHVAGHLYDLSVVSDRKYFWVTVCIWLAFLGSVGCGWLFITKP